MLVVISPAKKLDFETPTVTYEYTQPIHLHQACQLIKYLQALSVDELINLMGVSHNIATLNMERFRQWETPFKPENARQALFLFKGDVYIGLNAETMSEGNLNFAQRHLRILSGLYGLLRPLDLIQAYRLEMGTNLNTDSGKNLYQFWGSRITNTINKTLSSMNASTLINLASNEYFRSIQTKAIQGDIITPVFKEYRNGDYKIISFFAKKARGLMSRYIIDHALTVPESIKNFNTAGYTFNEKLSHGHNWVFSRLYPET